MTSARPRVSSSWSIAIMSPLRVVLVLTLVASPPTHTIAPSLHWSSSETVVSVCFLSLCRTGRSG